MPLSDKWFNSAKTIQESLGVLQQSGPNISGAAARAKMLLALNNQILATDRESTQVQQGTIAAAKSALQANREFLSGPVKLSILAMLAQVDIAVATIDQLLDDQQ